MVDQNNLEDRLHELLFGVRRSVRYHMRRQQFFERWHIVTSATSVIFGSATVALIISKMGAGWIVATAVVVTVFSAIDLVVGTSRAAHLHNDLARRFIDLEKKIIKECTPTEAMLYSLTSDRLSIEADEPPIFRNLDILCHNELLRAMGQRDAVAKLSPFQRLSAQFFDWRTHSIQ